MALPFIMLAVLFRGIENFKMFDMVNLLTGGGPGLDHRGRLDHAQARGLREVAHRLFLGLRHHPVRHGVRPRQHLREGAEPGEAAMSAHHRPFRRRAGHAVASASPARSSILYALVSMIPLFWIFATSFKTPPDSITYPPKVVFQPVARGLLQPLHHAHAADAGIHRSRCRRPTASATRSPASATW